MGIGTEQKTGAFAAQVKPDLRVANEGKDPCVGFQHIQRLGDQILMLQCGDWSWYASHISNFRAIESSRVYDGFTEHIAVGCFNLPFAVGRPLDASHFSEARNLGEW